jgi:hypothetical protein
MFIKPASELTLPAIEWLWPGYFAVGSLALLDGDPDLGKSMLTLDLAARVSAGRPWPDGAAVSAPAPVLLLCAEDPDQIVLPRLTALGAHLPRVYLWPRLSEPGLPQLPAEIGRVDETLAQTGAKLVIIDPIMAFWDRTVDVNTDAHARRALRPLVHLAEKHRCVMLLVRHLNKEGGPSVLYRGGGSIAFIAACRLAWLVGRDPQRDERCVLAQTKNNYAPKQPSLMYTLSRVGPGIEWHGPCAWSAADLIGRRERPCRRRARDLLRQFLSAGPRQVFEVHEAARANRISRGTLRRAKGELDIRHERISSKGKRLDFWLLPGQELPAGLSDTPLADAWVEDWAKKYPPPAEWKNDGCDRDSEPV